MFKIEMKYKDKLLDNKDFFKELRIPTELEIRKGGIIFPIIFVRQDSDENLGYKTQEDCKQVIEILNDIQNKLNDYGINKDLNYSFSVVKGDSNTVEIKKISKKFVQELREQIFNSWELIKKLRKDLRFDKKGMMVC